jgi:hypothetical protein
MTDETDDQRPIRTDPQLDPGGPGAQADVSQVGVTDADPDRRELRAEIGKYVSLHPFPTTAGELADAVAAAGAPQAVTQALVSLPADSRLENTRDLWLGLGLESNERF